jgi:hypothetical protein
MIVEVKVTCSRGPTCDDEAAVDAGEHDATSCSLAKYDVCGSICVIAEDGTNSTDLHHETWFVFRWSAGPRKRVSVLPFFGHPHLLAIGVVSYRMPVAPLSFRRSCLRTSYRLHSLYGARNVADERETPCAPVTLPCVTRGAPWSPVRRPAGSALIYIHTSRSRSCHHDLYSLPSRPLTTLSR